MILAYTKINYASGDVLTAEAMNKIQDISILLEIGAIEEAKTEFIKYKAYMQALEDTKNIDTSRKRHLIDIARELFLFYADMEM